VGKRSDVEWYFWWVEEVDASHRFIEDVKERIEATYHVREVVPIAARAIRAELLAEVKAWLQQWPLASGRNLAAEIGERFKP
jgi:hypothetical protein